MGRKLAVAAVVAFLVVAGGLIAAQTPPQIERAPVPPAIMRNVDADFGVVCYAGVVQGPQGPVVVSLSCVKLR